MGTQKDIARQIVDAQADYILALKANQGQLYEDVMEWFDWAESQSFEAMPVDYYQHSNKGHGRIETRRCWVIEDELAFEHIRHDGWAGLRSIVRLQRERRIWGCPPATNRLLSVQPTRRCQTHRSGDPVPLGR